MLQLDDIIGGDGLVAFVTLFVGNLVMLAFLAVNCGGKKEKSTAAPAGDKPAGDKSAAGGAPAPAGGAPSPAGGGASPAAPGGPGNPGAGSADVNVGPQSVHAFTAAAPPTPAA